MRWGKKNVETETRKMRNPNEYKFFSFYLFFWTIYLAKTDKHTVIQTKSRNTNMFLLPKTMSIEGKKKKKKNPPLRAPVLWHGSIFAYASSALTPCRVLNWIFNVNFLTSILPLQQTHWLDLLIVDTRD